MWREHRATIEQAEDQVEGAIEDTFYMIEKAIRNNYHNRSEEEQKFIIGKTREDMFERICSMCERLTIEFDKELK